MAASLWLLQLPSPPPLSTSRSSSPSSASPLLRRKHAPTRARGNLVCGSSGASSSSSVVTKDQEGAAPAPAPVSYDYRDDPNFRGCKDCGREETERGCNGEGRIMGGIAAVPLFGWWPIKAYRPCPGFVASGGRYRRYGQSMDDVIAGKGRKVPSNNKKSVTMEDLITRTVMYLASKAVLPLLNQQISSLENSNRRRIGIKQL